MIVHNRRYILVVISCFCILILNSCTKITDHNQNFCSINRCDDLKYFDCFNKKLSFLHIPNNLNIPTSTSLLHPNYDIPEISCKEKELINDPKNWKKPSICPPVILKNFDN